MRRCTPCRLTPQIASLFEPFALPRWHGSAALREFVVGVGWRLPLHRLSPFGGKVIVQKLMAHSGGLTRRITILLARAAELAILQKTESVVLNLHHGCGCNRHPQNHG